MQIETIPMHIVFIPAGLFRCIHLFWTIGDSNPALIINHFLGGRLLLHELFHQGEGCLILFKFWILCLNKLETEVVTGFSVLPRL